MEKKEYTKPSVEFVEFDYKDVVLSSGEDVKQSQGLDDDIF